MAALLRCQLACSIHHYLWPISTPSSSSTSITTTTTTTTTTTDITTTTVTATVYAHARYDTIQYKTLLAQETVRSL
jgi:hypothetical protein